MSKKYLFLPLFLLCAASFVSAQNAPQTTQPAAKPVAQKAAAQQPSEGQRIFDQNCSRCHTTPDGFSPHISGTVVMHMRVRANLSQHDMQELMRFFNP